MLPSKQDLPALSSILRGTPSAALSAHMVDLLYAYAYCKQLYNGDWGSGTATDSADVAQCALQLSVVLTDPAAAAATILISNDAVRALSHAIGPLLRACCSDPTACPCATPMTAGLPVCCVHRSILRWVAP